MDMKIKATDCESKLYSGVSWLVIRELMQQDSGKTQDGRMTKKCGARLCIPGLARHFYTSFCRPESYSHPVA